jgi:hypothetical protein
MRPLPAALRKTSTATPAMRSIRQRMPRASGGPAFDPEGDGYDYETARLRGMRPDADGHWSSRDPETGMLLKGRAHPTFNKGVEADRGLGYELETRDGRYYTTKKPDAATRIARACGGRLKRADGGGIPFNAGLLRAARPAGGRTDTLPVDVPAGCYVIPADIVSSLGEGDTEAGRHALDGMFKASARAARATGGNVGERVPIIAAGGEYIVSPEDVAALGNGDMKRGHQALDAFVKRQRARTVKTLSKLPGPVK